jgi:hypothetical protein
MVIKREKGRGGGGKEEREEHKYTLLHKMCRIN